MRETSGQRRRSDVVAYTVAEITGYGKIKRIDTREKMDMDTKTAKQEALELLAQMGTHRNPALEHRINQLTADRVDELIPPPEDAIQRAIERGSHSYVFSVDACLTLPIPPGCWWLMTSQANSTEGSAAIVLERNRQYAPTIPLAMLKAWWSIQPA